MEILLEEISDIHNRGKSTLDVFSSFVPIHSLLPPHLFIHSKVTNSAFSHYVINGHYHCTLLIIRAKIQQIRTTYSWGVFQNAGLVAYWSMLT